MTAKFPCTRIDTLEKLSRCCDAQDSFLAVLINTLTIQVLLNLFRALLYIFRDVGMIAE